MHHVNDLIISVSLDSTDLKSSFKQKHIVLSNYLHGNYIDIYGLIFIHHAGISEKDRSSLKHLEHALDIRGNSQFGEKSLSSPQDLIDVLWPW